MNRSTEQWSLAEWLRWMEECHPAEIELGLVRIQQVAQRMRLDLSRSRIVTIAGTNGKGSTVTYLEAMLRRAGYSVGCYTSPHFLVYNERVRVDGGNVSDSELCRAFRAVDGARQGVALTYFEFGTLAALAIFAQRTPDVILLEVGLGGRLDAVNIVEPDVAVVTTVALDHMDWLGDTREAIGREKAGIFRPGKAAICGDPEPPASVAAVAEALGAKLLQVGRQFSYSCEAACWCWQGQDEEGAAVTLAQLPYPQLPLPNAATAIQALHQLGLAVPEAAIREGIRDARLTGRMQHVPLPQGDCWLDVAHNPEAAALLAQRLAAGQGAVHLVLGMLADKDSATVIELLRPQVARWYLTDLGGPRGQKAAALATALQAGDQYQLHSSVGAALQAARSALAPGERLVVAGSFFTVSEALAVLGGEQTDATEPEV